MTSPAGALRFTLAAVAVALVALTACSTSPPKTTSPDTGSTPASVTPTQTTVPDPTTTTPRPTTSTVTTTKHVTVTPTPKSSAVSASPISSTSSSTTNNAAASCLTAHLDLASEGGGGAGGTDYRGYSFTNTGSHTCTMRGYAGVSIVDSAGHTVQHPAQRGRTGTQQAAPVKTIVLKPNSRAYFLVTSIDVIPSSPDCQHAFHGHRLRVYPPNNTAPLYLNDTSNFCDLGVGAITQNKNP